MALLTYDVNDEDLSRWGTPALLQETLELVVQKSLGSGELYRELYKDFLVIESSAESSTESVELSRELYKNRNL